MKKILLMGTVLLLAGFCIALGSCDDDNDNPNYTSPTVISEFDVDFDRELLELVDVSVTYTDFTGTTYTEKVTTDDWKKELRSSEFPVTTSYKLNVTRKANVALTRDYYDLDAEVKFEADSHFKKEKQPAIADREFYLSRREHVPAAEVEAEINNIIEASKALDIAYRFTLTGNHATGTSL